MSTCHTVNRVIRLQKFLADAGVASRRAGGTDHSGRARAASTARPVRLLGTKVDPVHDEVTVDGKPVRVRRKLYVALHKPVGCVCSRQDELGRPTIYDLLPKEWQNLHSVGRLDFNREGLLFLTNDGQFALRLTHPRYGVRKKYVATVEGGVDRAMLGAVHAGRLARGRKTQGAGGAADFGQPRAQRGGTGIGRRQKPRSAAAV